YSAAMAACFFGPSIANAQTGALTMTGQAAATQHVNFDVLLPLRNKDKLEALLKAQQDPASPQYHKWLTPAQFGAQFGPDKAALEKVANYLKSRGFAVKIDTRSVRATGTAAQVDGNFRVHLMTAQTTPG